MASRKIVREIVSSAKAPKAVGPYSQAVVVDRTVYLAGVLGMDLKTNKLVEGDAANQARQALNNMKNILEDAGSGIDRVVKTTILLKDIADLSVVNEVYKEFFTQNFPARTSYQVAGLPLGALFEMEAIAVTGEVETV